MSGEVETCSATWPDGTPCTDLARPGFDTCCPIPNCPSNLRGHRALLRDVDDIVRWRTGQ